MGPAPTGSLQISCFSTGTFWVLPWTYFYLIRPNASATIYILQRGVQWKQGVVFCTVLYISLLYNTTRIHCTPLPLHPPLQSIQVHVESLGFFSRSLTQIDWTCWGFVHRHQGEVACWTCRVSKPRRLRSGGRLVRALPERGGGPSFVLWRMV